jgi:hypothetical protein
MRKLWKRFINWYEMKSVIKAFLESSGASNMSKKEIDIHIEMIKNQYKFKQQEQ